MKTFGDYSVATQMRDAITQIATRVVNELRPRDVYAKVISIDSTKMQCEVQFRNEPKTVVFPMGTIQPTKPGQRVRISGSKGDRYISDVVTVGGGTFSTAGTGGTTTTTSVTPIIPYARVGVLTVVTGISRFRWPVNATIVGVSAAVTTAPIGSAIIVDVNRNGSSIFNAGNRPQILAGTNGTLSEVSPDNFTMTQGDYITVDIDQVGSSVAGSDLTVFVRYRQAA